MRTSTSKSEGKIRTKADAKHGAVAHCHHHSAAAHETLERSVTALKEAGYKMTSSRRLLLDAMCKLTPPFTTDEVFRALKANACDLVTVYRTLSTLETLQVLTRVELSDGVIRYEFAGPRGHHHHHFVCTKCGAIEELDLCSNQSGQIQKHETELSTAGYTKLTHRLEFYGLCPACSAR